MHLRINEPVVELAQAHVLAEVLEEDFNKDATTGRRVLLSQPYRLQHLTIKARFFVNANNQLKKQVTQL